MVGLISAVIAVGLGNLEKIWVRNDNDLQKKKFTISSCLSLSSFVPSLVSGTLERGTDGVEGKFGFQVLDGVCVLKFRLWGVVGALNNCSDGTIDRPGEGATDSTIESYCFASKTPYFKVTNKATVR